MSPQTEKKQGRNKHKQVITLLFVCLVIVGAVLVGLKLINKPEDCSKVLASAAKLADNNQAKQSYSQLKAASSRCTTVAATSKQNKTQLAKAQVQAINYGVTLATTAFNNGDRQQAYKSIDQVEAIIKTMSPAEQAKVPNSTSLAMQITTIQTMRASSHSSQ